jgi:excisionase family DNA binding protein
MSSNKNSATVAEASNELMTLPEAAARFRIKLATIRAWRLSRRHLPFVKVAGKVLVRRQDVEALIFTGIEEPLPLQRKSQKRERK